MRPTHEFKTSAGNVVMAHDYITVEESWAIKKIHMKAATKGADIGEIGEEAEKKALSFVIVSIDGVSDGVVDAIFKLPNNIGEEIAEHVSDVLNPKKK